MASTPAHAPSAPRRRGWWLTAGILVVAVALIATAVLLVTRNRGGNASAVAVPKVVPLHVVSTTPTGSTVVPSSAVITVGLSTPLATKSPMPSLSPPVPGSWSALSASELQFVSDGPLLPGSQETLTVPGGPSGILGAHGQHLATTVTSTFSVAQGSTLRLQQLLGQLGYLPVSFSPTTAPASPQQAADPQQGTFAWRWADLPPQLTALWTPGTYNVITKGAVMNFQSQHNLATDGLAGPRVWADLLAAAASGAANPQPYDNVLVQKSGTQMVYVYRDGVKVYSTVASTGVDAAPTVDGTFPVFARYTVTTMRGTNPDGSKYVDPGIPWVSYFNGGDALHGFVRSSYGFPQSVGCVELPPANAAVIYPMTPIGTLVTVV